MIWEGGIRWFVTLCIFLPQVNLQFPMQLLQMPPMFGLPPPLPPPPPLVSMPVPPLPAMSFQIALPMSIPIAKPRVITTTERSIGVALPIQLPFPIPVAIPAQPSPDFCKRSRSNNCPVCPPCMCNPCTPAFFSFCSPCHQKCRCRDRNNVPEPLPLEAQVPVSGSAFAVPIATPYLGPSPYVPPFKKMRIRQREESDENTYDSNLESFEWSRRSKWSKKKAYKNSRRSYRSGNMDSNENEDDLVKPVLSYISRDGAVKLEKSLSDDEAEDLLDDTKVNQRVYVTAGEDSEKRQRLQVVSHAESPQQDGQTRNHQRRQVVLTPGSVQHMLGEGKKELVFNPPIDKKISNLSVSFQIT